MRANEREAGRKAGLEEAATTIEKYDEGLRKLMDAALRALSIECGRAGSRGKCKDRYGPLAKAVMPFVDMPGDARLATAIRALGDKPAEDKT